MSCPLYIRSVYTLLSSMCSIEGIVSYGKKYGYNALGLEDRNVLAGAMSFKKACEKAKMCGLTLDEMKEILELSFNNDENWKVNIFAIVC